MTDDVSVDPGHSLDDLAERSLEDLGREMWGVHHALARTPRRRGGSAEERLELIDSELEVRDVLRRYTYFYDGKDLDGLMSVFHPECRLVNPRGTYVGTEAIRANYEYLMGQFRLVFHYAPNVIVRVLDRKHAWLSSYLFAVGAVGDTEDGRVNGNCSSYVARLLREDGEWVIREMRITTNVPLDLQRRADPMRGFGDPPAPTEEVSSGDWIGKDHVA